MRILTIAWVLSKYGIFYRFGPHRNKILGERLRLACEELGLAFIKIGQILSMRYDLLSDEDCAALQGLLDRVAPIPFATIQEILKKEYAGIPGEIFAHIDETPLGSASVSQVHKATLANGKLVAIKIKRPGVDETFLTDVALFRRVARLAAWCSPTLRQIRIAELVDYFEGWLRQDLDFVAEVRNMKKINEQYSFAKERQIWRGGAKGVFPLPFDHLCTDRVIVMDFIDGIPMSRKEELLANPDYDVRTSIIVYVNAALRNWFRDDGKDYYFQGDPHLSNTLALPHGDVASVDFGLISSLSPRETRLCRELILAVYMKDLERTLELGAIMLGTTRDKVSAAMKDDVVRYLDQAPSEGLGYWFLEFVRIGMRHGLNFPLFLTTFGRTNIVLDGLVHAYMPEETTIGIFGDELRRQVLKEALKNLKGADWTRLGYSIAKTLKDAPGSAGRIIEDPLAFVSNVMRAVRT